jgi:hypothetical protein
MSTDATNDLDPQPLRDSAEATDSEQKVFGFGTGGVPWYLLLFYLSFLTFFVWYVLEFQLPDYLYQGPGQGGEPGMTSTQ